MHTRPTFIHDLARSISLRWTHLTAAAAFLIVAFCAASPLCASNGVTFTTPVNVSSDGLGNFPQALVDSSGNIDIAYADVNFTGSCPPTLFSFDCPTGGIKFLRSTNGGKTFSEPVALAQTGAGPFSMALESDCTIDVAYFAKGDVFFAQSTDCGQSFTALNVTNIGTTPPEDSIRMVVNQGLAQIAWQTGGNGNFLLHYAQGNSKTGFTAPIVLATDNGLVGLVGMAVSNKITDLVWWQGEFHYTIRFLNFINGTQPVDVADDQEIDGDAGPSFSLDPAGNMYLAWGAMDVPFNGINSNHVIQFARSVGQTGNFGNPRNPQIVACCGAPRIATDPQGNIGLVWNWAQFIRSTDGGATFSAPLNVSAGAGGSPDPDLPAQLVLPSTSFAGIAWGAGFRPLV